MNNKIFIEVVCINLDNPEYKFTRGTVRYYRVVGTLKNLSTIVLFIPSSFMKKDIFIKNKVGIIGELCSTQTYCRFNGVIHIMYILVKEVILKNVDYCRDNWISYNGNAKQLKSKYDIEGSTTMISECGFTFNFVNYTKIPKRINTFKGILLSERKSLQKEPMYTYIQLKQSNRK